jgi:NAD-dependent deacetylase
VLTQNVDGLHREAGSRNVVDIHGDIRELYCTACGARKRVHDYSGLQIPPHCERCGAILRPDVVLFGEILPDEKWRRFHDELQYGFDLIFSIGTRSAFPYIAEPMHYARRAGLPTVEINPDSTEVSYLVDVKLPMRAAEALDALWSRYRGRQGV